MKHTNAMHNEIAFIIRSFLEKNSEAREIPIALKIKADFEEMPVGY